MEVNWEEDLHLSIIEHLLKEGYVKAVKALKEESKTKKKVKPNPRK